MPGRLFLAGAAHARQSMAASLMRDCPSRSGQCCCGRRTRVTLPGLNIRRTCNGCARAPESHGADRRRSPAREGPALLQGLVMCGMCGRRMTVRYHSQSKGLVPTYLCQQEVKEAEPICQSIPGSGIDQAIGELLLEVVTPVALEVALAVQEELRARAEEADRLRRT